MPSRVIVNADDFGLNEHTNAVILHAFHSGLISSATAMATMPAFKAACALAQQPALRGRVGLHFNLTYGKPLSEAIRALPQFCNSNGEFDLKLSRKRLWLGRQAREAVAAELAAQWQHCLDCGLTPSHLDSHQHVHNLWPIGEIVARFAAREGVPIRLARNVGHNIGPAKRLFKTLLNQRLRTPAGLAFVQVGFFGQFFDRQRLEGANRRQAAPVTHRQARVFRVGRLALSIGQLVQLVQAVGQRAVEGGGHSCSVQWF